LVFGITTQGETLEELRTMVREAVACYFDDPASGPLCRAWSLKKPNDDNDQRHNEQGMDKSAERVGA
jgi:hypothetical protein